MIINLKNKKSVVIRPYEESDFEDIHQLNQTEGWNNLVDKYENTKQAWGQSNLAFIVKEHNRIIGYVRGLTDGSISLYICELLIDQRYRGFGIGKKLLKYVHSVYPKTRIEMLASSTSQSFYETNRYRPFYGFRKTFEEQ